MRCFRFLVFIGWWLLATAACAASSPDTAAIVIRSLPANGLLLQKGWRYHAGDNPAWARPGFDDSRWDTLNPTRPIRQLPPRLRTGISWLRLRLKFSDSLRLQQLILQGEREIGAWELYLNGRLVQRNGVLAAQLARTQSNGMLPKPVDVMGADHPAELVLAVRYAPWQSSILILPRINESYILGLHLMDGAYFLQLEIRRAASGLVYYVVGSLFVLLALLHLAFFYYNPTRRANLYFASYTGTLALASLGNYYISRLPFSNLSVYILFVILIFILLWLSGIWAVRALYTLFNFRPGWFYTGLWVGGSILMVWMSLSYFAANYFSILLAALVLNATEQLRLIGRALSQRRRGARIISAGFALALLAALGLAGGNMAVLTLPRWVLELSYPLIFLSPALGISLYLAREFALDAELLQVKLGEVERLSAQMLAQEQEKQALLAQQNETLETQVAQRTGELQLSLNNLRTTQTQLIQAEKMASLGELTAGIAHEIQNPLNFVNNFADVSAELMTELEEAQAAGDAAEVSALAADVRQNLRKISQHGQRASGIVRGMLEHSRASSGERAPTDLNQLADEYLRLAYHGLRAKDKGFNVTLATDFAPDLPPVEAVAGDLGRVLLNLFTNAFYAVQQRQQAGETDYAPTVGVGTRQVGNQVEICVSDNGTGIPAAVQAKIFQPFFTTKPTGEGTGLGLSLSYDIVTKGHGGTLAVESREGEGTTFILTLPQ